jgi:hypothetical protein
MKAECQSPFDDEKPIAAIITLVHGTFAQDALWTQEGSGLHTALAELPGADVRIERFNWSGRNRFEDRIVAAKELAMFIRRQNSEDSGVLQLVVAHSHGGSVLAYLLTREPEAAKCIAGAAFLATPFVDARPRPDWPLIATTTAISVTICASALASGGLLCAIGAAKGSDHDLVGMFFLFVYFAQALFSASVLFRLSRPSRKFSRLGIASLAESISCSRFPEGRYLFLRSTGDEAASALGAAQFASWLMSQLVFAVVRPLSRLRGDGFLVIMAGLLGAWGGIIPALVFLDYYPTATGPIDITWWATHLLEMIALFFRDTWWLGLMIASGCGVFLGALLVGIFWILCCLVCWLGHRSFGRLSFLTALFMDLAVDVVPVGKHVIVHESWTDAPSSGLLHSSPYMSSSALEVLVDWVKATLNERC